MSQMEAILDGPRWHSTWPSPPAMTRAEYPVGGSWRTGSLARPKWGGWSGMIPGPGEPLDVMLTSGHGLPCHPQIPGTRCCPMHQHASQPSLLPGSGVQRPGIAPGYWSHLAQAETTNYGPPGAVLWPRQVGDARTCAHKSTLGNHSHPAPWWRVWVSCSGRRGAYPLTRAPHQGKRSGPRSRRSVSCSGQVHQRGQPGSQPDKGPQG